MLRCLAAASCFLLEQFWSPSELIWATSTSGKPKWRSAPDPRRAEKKAYLRQDQYWMICCQISCMYGISHGLKVCFGEQRPSHFPQREPLTSPAALRTTPFASTRCSWDSAASWSCCACEHDHVAGQADLWPCQHQHERSGGDGGHGEGSTAGCSFLS